MRGAFHTNKISVELAYMRLLLKSITIVTLHVGILFSSPLPTFSQQLKLQNSVDFPDNNKVIIHFRNNYNRRIAAQFYNDNLIPRQHIFHGLEALSLGGGKKREKILKHLKDLPDLVSAEIDERRPSEFVPNDPSLGSQWFHTNIASYGAWDVTKGSRTVIVAILDTGVDSTHPDLATNIVQGWNAYDNNSDTRDVHGHGTAVAGSVGMVGNNGIGGAGGCPDCKIMPIRITDTTGYTSYSTAATALVWAADHGARVANLSFMVSESDAVKTAASYFMSKGGVVTVSAGNYGTNNPAPDNPALLTVSATGSNDAVQSWSNFGNNVDLSAPGTGIYLTTNGGGYGSWSGTSFSAPIVASTAALVLSTAPQLTAQQVMTILQDSADDQGTPGKDIYYGYGRVNAKRAVQLANSFNATATPTPTSTSTPTPTPTPTATPTVTPVATSTPNPSTTEPPKEIPTPIPTETSTPTATVTATATPSPIATATPARHLAIDVGSTKKITASQWGPMDADHGYLGGTAVTRRASNDVFASWRVNPISYQLSLIPDSYYVTLLFPKVPGKGTVPAFSVWAGTSGTQRLVRLSHSRTTKIVLAANVLNAGLDLHFRKRVGKILLSGIVVNPFGKKP